jgi:hypothetical protein
MTWFNCGRGGGWWIVVRFPTYLSIGCFSTIYTAIGKTHHHPPPTTFYGFRLPPRWWNWSKTGQKYAPSLDFQSMAEKESALDCLLARLSGLLAALGYHSGHQLHWNRP